MNWFDTSGLTSLAKTALKEAQKTIDKALDIQDDSDEDSASTSTVPQTCSSSAGTTTTSVNQNDNSDFFSSWGLNMSAEVEKESSSKDLVVTASPSKSSQNNQTMWGSFAGSFFEQTKVENAIVRPPKAKSMNVICEKYDSQEDLFSKSQLVMSDGAEMLESKKDNIVKLDDRRKSSLSNAISLVSSRHSSDSVEVLSQSLKTTPDSEGISYQSASQSSSLKPTSDSVEILPDSLVSPNSIECLGFDSYSSDVNSGSSSDVTPVDEIDKRTPIGKKTDKVNTDSVSLVAEDDEDTMSYNSISECTAPTVLDTDEKPISPHSKVSKIEHRKSDKDFLHIETVCKMQISENSSNDGSWSDRTLNADNESIILENVSGETKKENDHEDISIEKLSDSSSFYNVQVSSTLQRSSSNTFVNVEQQKSPPDSNDSSQKEASTRERTSPVSSDSKSDLVKIGSDRTSGHTSGDEIETATSSDIEIIPSPNGDHSHGCRSSPGKYGLRQKLDGATSPNLVDLVLGKNLATKIRGHNRELSDASVKSNTSDESQGCENERLMRRLSEMAEILDARENRLMEVTRSNAELVESNVSLKSQVESLLAKHESSDINTITEDYTQRMSALEKKFQQAIREKDQLRKQLDNLKQEISRKNSTAMETTLKEKEDMISQLQEEGEKLARQELQHSNIIKKLRTKERDNEQVIKSLRDKIAELTSEVDRMRRSMSAKEELEVSQIEAVYRLTNANKKLESELIESNSALDDSTQNLETARKSLEIARREITDLQRTNSDLQKYKTSKLNLEAACEKAEREAEMLRHELKQLRIERAREEQRWLSREEALRREMSEARSAGELERGDASAAAALLQQVAALQRGALERDRAHAAAAAHLAEVETMLAKVVEREKLSREENHELLERLARADTSQRDSQTRIESVTEHWQSAERRLNSLEDQLNSKTKELEEVKHEKETQIEELERRVSETTRELDDERTALDTERKRNVILQEQMCVRGAGALVGTGAGVGAGAGAVAGDVSPPHSVVSDTMSASFWNEDTASISGGGGGWGGVWGVEEALAALSRREGERRGLADTVRALRGERDALRGHLADVTERLNDLQSLREQYDALLQMYGEKEEQVSELRLDLHDVTQLYKAQLDELVALKQTNR